jgi:hypothetical protein
MTGIAPRGWNAGAGRSDPCVILSGLPESARIIQLPKLPRGGGSGPLPLGRSGLLASGGISVQPGRAARLTRRAWDRASRFLRAAAPRARGYPLGPSPLPRCGVGAGRPRGRPATRSAEVQIRPSRYQDGGGELRAASAFAKQAGGVGGEPGEAGGVANGLR